MKGNYGNKEDVGACLKELNRGGKGGSDSGGGKQMRGAGGMTYGFGKKSSGGRSGYAKSMNHRKK